MLSRFTLLVLVISCAAGCNRRRDPLSVVPGWEVRPNGTGLALSWDFTAPQLRGEKHVTAEFRDGQNRFAQPLESPAGTLFYTPKSSDVSVTLRILSAPGGPERNVLAWDQERAASRIPVTVSRTGARPVRLLTSVRHSPVPEIPPTLVRRFRSQFVEVEVFIKINGHGKVAAASTRYYSDPVQKQVADLATAAAFRWTFDPVRIETQPVYADAKLQFRFPAGG